MINRILERLFQRAEYLKDAMIENSENGYKNSAEKAMNELVAIKYAIEIVQEVAKEYGRKLNRCDTCTHYTSEEIVPPICYFCCKGLENNYKAREEN